MSSPKKPELLVHLSATAWLRREAQTTYELEVVFREEGQGSERA